MAPLSWELGPPEPVSMWPPALQWLRLDTMAAGLEEGGSGSRRLPYGLGSEVPECYFMPCSDWSSLSQAHQIPGEGTLAPPFHMGRHLYLQAQEEALSHIWKLYTTTLNFTLKCKVLEEFQSWPLKVLVSGLGK